eukprot:scaffold113480_cov48-Phaeocystis_antarctica.AAC.2
MSSTRSCARIASDGSVAIYCSVVRLTLSPKPHANTVAPCPLTRAAASTAVCQGNRPGAASTVCSPPETSSTTLVAPTRPPSAKSCRAASKPSEIEVQPDAVIASIPTLISATSYDHGTRFVASVAKDTTEKRAASSPREYMFTSFFAKAFSPPGPSIEPSGRGIFIEPLSSSTRAKSTGGGGNGGGSGGDGGSNCTTKDPVPCLGPLAKEKLCPKPGAAHSFPFQPSPNESVMSRVHFAPSATANGTLE